MAQLDDALISRMSEAQTKFICGDPEPLLQMWSRREPVSQFGGYGVGAVGWADASANARRMSARFTNGSDYRHDVRVNSIEGDGAYLVAVETANIGIDGAPPVEVTMRVTMMFRHEDGDWKICHRQAEMATPQ